MPEVDIQLEKSQFFDWLAKIYGRDIATQASKELSGKQWPPSGGLFGANSNWGNLYNEFKASLSTVEVEDTGLESELYNKNQPPSFNPPDGTKWEWQEPTYFENEDGTMGVSEARWVASQISTVDNDLLDSLNIDREQFEWQKQMDIWEMRQYENEKYWEQEKARLETTKSSADAWMASMMQPVGDPLAEQKLKEAQWNDIYNEIKGELENSPELNWIKIAKLEAMKNPYQILPGAEEAAMSMVISGTIDTWENAIESLNEKIAAATAPEEIERLKSEMAAVQSYIGSVGMNSQDISGVMESYQQQIDELDDMASDPYNNITYADPIWAEKRDELQKKLESAKKQKADVDAQALEMASYTQPFSSVNKNLLETPDWLKPFVKSDTLNLKNLESAATPSMQSWNALSESEKIGLKGYANETGDNWTNLAGRMTSMLPQGSVGTPSWSSAYRRI